MTLTFLLAGEKINRITDSGITLVIADQGAAVKKNVTNPEELLSEELGESFRTRRKREERDGPARASDVAAQLTAAAESSESRLEQSLSDVQRELCRKSRRIRQESITASPTKIARTFLEQENLKAAHIEGTLVEVWECVEVEVTLRAITKDRPCHQDMPITAEFSEGPVESFLAADNEIVETSPIMPCSSYQTQAVAWEGAIQKLDQKFGVLAKINSSIQF
uniref:Uncharacterized protein n=1 Tax=Ditylenchus dipsaci TaxID=166011 RepID=A0A915EUD6_9BILA